MERKLKRYSRRAVQATRKASPRLKRWAGQVEYDNKKFMTLSTRIERPTAYRFKKYCDIEGTTPYEVIKLMVGYWLVAVTLERGEVDNIDEAFKKVFEED